MNVIPVTELTREVARRVIWFEPPDQALAEPIRFMAYAMTYARNEDMRLIRQYLTDACILEALDNAPAGIIDARSWAYWNLKMGRYPAPPLPMRTLGALRDVGNRALARPVQRVGSPPKTDLEETRRLGREAWKALRGGQSSTPDLEELRRQARESWRNRYVDRK